MNDLQQSKNFKYKRVIADCIYAGVGGEGAIYVNAPSKCSWTARLTGGAAQWSHFKGASSGTGDAIVRFEINPNPHSDRQGELIIEEDGDERLSSHSIRQGSGAGVKIQTDEVMRLPFLEVPLIMELGIAGKFVAQKIKKIPEPFDLIALVIVEAIVAIGGILTATLRSAIPTDLLPMPKSVFAYPPLPPPSPFPVPGFINLSKFENLLENIPITPGFIYEQTATLCAYIAIETLGGD